LEGTQSHTIQSEDEVGVRVDLKAFAVTFGLVFLAELGDKTQLTTMMLAARARAPILIFIAAGLALLLSSLIGVVFGEALTRLVPLRYIQIGAGVAFVLIGGILLMGKAA
jgi:putative Ca2+/H+ antiporter (TMEM165/GDT1 family)